MSYFSICQSPIFAYNIQSRTTLTSCNCIMIDDYFIYPNAHDAKNALCLLDMNSVHLNKNALGQYHFDIVVAQNIIKTRNIVQMIQIHSANKSNQSGKLNNTDEYKEQKTVTIVMITNSQICTIQILIKKQDQSLTLTHKILQSSYLLYQPHKSLLDNNHLNINSQNILFNMQVLTANSYNGTNSCYKQMLVVLGYSVSHKIIANIYAAERKSIDPSILKFITRCDLSYPSNIDHFQYNFTLTSPNPQSVFIYLYQIFNQKGQPLKLFQYNLTELIYSPSSSACHIQPEKLSCHLGSLHNHFHIKSIHQQHNDLYITYTRYTPYIDKSKITQNPPAKPSPTQTHLWIYNVELGYTKNIIDMEGSVLNMTIINNQERSFNGLKEQIQKSIVFVLVNQDNQSLYQFNQSIPCLYTTQIVKMNSTLYNPKFSIPTQQQTPLIIGLSSKYFISIDKEAMNIRLNIYEKINKKSIYCSMWQQLGSVGGSRLLQQVLQIL